NGFRLGPIAVPGLGYIIATGLFVPAAARVLGSRQLLRDLIVGFAIATVVYVGFTRYLGVRLPAGPLDLFG
ncbi:MAG: tripartite tricarboxylate transporter TctB family protein, partial [Chloroflexota bacterium]|nr:tripartite tricarboxylate transporter TctB family protein [Chloroflexota bacterium]